MAPKHDNPTRPRIDRNQRRCDAFAPYNFVPLPEKIVTARGPIDQDSYSEGVTGWIDCDMETCSPTYVRGMLTEAQYVKFGKAKAEDLTVEQKRERAPFFSMSTQRMDNYRKPAIPGSTLRGMIRTLVEIAGYCRMRWVGDKPAFTFRAVAAPRDDPLRAPYEDALGRFGDKVRAGYLEKKNDRWFIRTALAPESLGLPDKGPFLKVREKQIGGKDIPGYRRFNSRDYMPTWRQVSFNALLRTGRKGQFCFVDRIGSREENYPFKGTLVCSGNMIETAGDTQKSPRRSHTLIMQPDESAELIRIPDTTVEDYRNSLTAEQKKLTAWGGEDGCLKQGAPVFFVRDGDHVAYFGHCPNFRIPMRIVRGGESRAARPTDFIPDLVGEGPHDDLADAIFGWADDSARDSGNQRAGRVFFGDAHFVSAEDGVWASSEAITPPPLAGPKPTTFQHYLVQDKRAGHDPDDKSSLAHYGAPPAETQIRGYKLYWHKGDKPRFEASPMELETDEKQLTRILPIKAGVHFSFRIRFENLRNEELGALLWVLLLPGKPGADYRHKLGMGKPLGMGAIKISPRLYLSDRAERYASLFKAGKWREAVEGARPDSYLKAFEKYMLEEGGIGPEGRRFFEVERIQMLLTMLEWREGDPDWLERTRYMEIEHGKDKINEYKERPVLPDPLAVAGRGVERPDDEAASPSKSASSSAIEPPVEAGIKGPPNLQIAAVVEGVVRSIDSKGNLVVELSGGRGGRKEARASVRSLGGAVYSVGDKAVFMVTAIRRGPDKTAIECKPVNSGISEHKGNPLPVETGEYRMGRVRVFERGKGVIEPEDGGPLVFVHKQHLAGSLLNLEKEEVVLFRTAKGMLGPEARDVRLKSSEED